MIPDENPAFTELKAAKLRALMGVLREQPALRDRDMGEFDRMGYLLDRCGMDHSGQRRFVYDLQERCRGGFPPGLIERFDEFTLDTFAAHLARTSWGEPSDVGPANDD